MSEVSKIAYSTVVSPLRRLGFIISLSTYVYILIILISCPNRGWVRTEDVIPFTSSSFAKHFDEKKFKVDIKYRNAMIEAVR